MATRCCSFEVQATLGAARTGTLSLPHGQVPTPCFMPVGTRATVRGVSTRELTEVGASMVLANTYHLWVRPGHRLIERLGGLHRFMDWSGPILTDSGGYQVFSLKDRTKVSEEGVTFRSPEDGAWRLLTPEVSVEVQEALGVDVAMAFDECLEWPADRARTRVRELTFNELPIVGPDYSVCLRLRSDLGRQMRMTTFIVDPRKKKIGRADTSIDFRGKKEVDHVMAFPALRYETQGQYKYVVELEGEPAGELDLLVVEIEDE